MNNMVNNYCGGCDRYEPLMQSDSQLGCTWKNDPEAGSCDAGLCRPGGRDLVARTKVFFVLGIRATVGLLLVLVHRGTFPVTGWSRPS